MTYRWSKGVAVLQVLEASPQMEVPAPRGFAVQKKDLRGSFVVSVPWGHADAHGQPRLPCCAGEEDTELGEV